MAMTKLQRGGGAKLALHKDFDHTEALRCSFLHLTRFKKGFTLAEVLITLGIIGVVAALTMPALVAKYEEKVTTTRLKKFYSAMSQAYAQAIVENGTPDGWNLIASGSAEGAENYLNTLAPYLKLTKNCGREAGCYPDVIYKYLQGTNNTDNTATNAAKAISADGVSFSFLVRSPNCSQSRGNTPLLSNVCGVILVDINGFKPPNQAGKDLFHFILAKEAIIPCGTKDETFYPFETTCNLNNNGYGCAAWVIYNENMDYLHCDNLSWDGPVKCD